MTDLSCYGAQIAGVADLVGDCDLRSSTEVSAWYRLEWQAMADVLGFAQQFAAALPARASSSSVAALTQAGLEAFAVTLRHGPKESDSQARTQSSVIQQLVTTGRERGELWRVTVDPSTLPTGACYVEGDQALRAFYPDTAPGYFGEGWQGPPPRAESACGWQTPLVLHLGTFPWVYSSRIDGAGPGAAVGLGEGAPGSQRPAAGREPHGTVNQPAPGRPSSGLHLQPLRRAHAAARRSFARVPGGSSSGWKALPAGRLSVCAPGEPARRSARRTTGASPCTCL
jgi:hypothetical protein